MKKTYTTLLFLLMFYAGHAQVYLNDDFTSWPQGWSFYGTPCPGQYSAVQDFVTGATAPCAKINKSNCNAPCAASVEAGITKTVTFPVPAAEFIFSVKYEAFSGTALSIVTNAHLRIRDVTNNNLIYSGCLACGGTTETNWQTFTDTFSIGCHGTSEVEIYLYTIDAWSSPGWCKTTRFDSPYLNVTETGTGQPINLTINSYNSPSCISCSDGNISFSVGGGIPPLSTTIIPNAGSIGSNSITGLPADTYQVCITDSANCQVCQTVALPAPGTGIQDLTNGSISIFPNPVAVDAQIRLPENKNEHYIIRLYDLPGRLFREIKVEGNEFILERSTLSEGVNFIQIHIQDGTMIYTGKLIVP